MAPLRTTDHEGHVVAVNAILKPEYLPEILFRRSQMHIEQITDGETIKGEIQDARLKP